MRKSWFSSPSRAPSQRRIYYAKLKLAKQQEAQRARKTKIVKKIAMKKRRVNHTKERKIKIGANRRQATPASITNQISSSSDNASARYCFRCERRMDRCREEGCHPYEFHVDKQRFDKFLSDFDRPGQTVRYTADAMDVQVMRKWALAAADEYGTSIMLLGLIVCAHFKSLRTWGMIKRAFQRAVNWDRLKEN